MATYEINKFIAKSSIYKQAMSYPNLNDDAIKKAIAYEEMSPIVKYINRRQMSGNPMPFWEYELKVEELKNISCSYGINDTAYPTNVLNDISFQCCAGTLLWSYEECSGFVSQWSYINAFFLIILVIALIILVFSPSVLSQFWFYILKGIPAVLLISNGWVYSRMPEVMGIKYWIVPGTLFIFCIILAIFILVKRDSHHNNQFGSGAPRTE